jgi:hypothetical protein
VYFIPTGFLDGGAGTLIAIMLQIYEALIVYGVADIWKMSQTQPSCGLAHNEEEQAHVRF